MKKILTLVSLLTILTVNMFAKQISENEAKQVGYNFLKFHTRSATLHDVSTLNLVYSVSGKKLPSGNSDTYFYVFNADNNGFVIVTGDDNAIPVLGYSDQSTFDPNHIPTNTSKWLESYKNEIRFIIDNNVAATDEITTSWQSLMDKDQHATASKTTTVSPLVQTHWDQAPYYNDQCPGGSVTGCVATAMAQVMKYWNYPANGSGFHSYNHATYGTLSANFGSTAYQWSSMPNSVSSPNSAVATLMYHCGVSVDMDYSPQSSGAYVISSLSPVTNCAEYALKTYFGYPSSIQGLERGNYTQTQWLGMLKTELDNSRPIIYAGVGTGGGHCFVADGYDMNDFIHFNWGWSGAYDGYFEINSLNPSGTGTGGGSGGFNSSQHAILGIQPPGSSSNASLSLYNYVTPATSTIYYGGSFNINTNVYNNGTGTFNGDICAAVFDVNNNFVDYVQTYTSVSLPAGNIFSGGGVTFSSTGILAMLPGTYSIGIFYRLTGGNWVMVANSGSYINQSQITVINPSDLELYSAIAVTPGTTLTQGQPASVNLNIANTGTSTFVGQYEVNLYHLDGTFVQTINTINENNGLPSGYAYVSPYLTFSTSSITAPPGTYLLALQHKATSSTTWSLTGSTYYQNPIIVTVQAAPIQPDQYEVNNTVGQSYNLPLSFSGNSVTQNTVGSNLHNAADVDFYQITLASGYTYSINARIHDAYNSGNGNTYTVDALWSYSFDGINWSTTYDDVMLNSISAVAGTVYFKVAPYFVGQTGTYLLDMTINRTPISSIQDNDIDNVVKLYPIPAHEKCVVDISDVKNPKQLNLTNAQGQRLKVVSGISNSDKVEIELSNYAAGVYFIQIQTQEGIITKKLVVE